MDLCGSEQEQVQPQEEESQQKRLGSTTATTKTAAEAAATEFLSESAAPSPTVPGDPQACPRYAFTAPGPEIAALVCQIITSPPSGSGASEKIDQ